MRTAFIAAIAASAMAVPAVAAAGPSYNYVDLGYLNLDMDEGGSVDGFGGNASFGITDMFHVLAGYGRLTDADDRFSVSSVALGLNLPIADTTDFVTRFGWVQSRATVLWPGIGFVDFKDDGWMMQAGVRSMVTPFVEVNAFLTRTDVGGASDTSIGAGAAYHFTPVFAVFGGFDYSDGDTLGSFGVRFSF